MDESFWRSWMNFCVGSCTNCFRPSPTATAPHPHSHLNNMSEDERYRTSTQYRLWSYTPQALLALRTTTNQIAADGVREAVRRIRDARNISSGNTTETENGKAAPAVMAEGEVDCLTVEEELKLVAFYCRQTMQLGDHLKVPTDVKVFALCSLFYFTQNRWTLADKQRLQLFNISSASI